ncbi:MAG: hypothetical protein IPM45_18375 [Acidimicrobiales bacterium]|nr:hypothetical protein [Acidimicrobiales bacterium]
MADTNPQAGLALNGDGSAAVHHPDGRTWRLRIPTLGEFAELRDRTFAWNDDLTAAALAAARDADTQDLTDPDVVLSQRRAGRTLQERIRTGRTDWWAHTVWLLGGDELREPAVWMATDETAIARLLRHWQTCPEASGT